MNYDMKKYEALTQFVCLANRIGLIHYEREWGYSGWEIAMDTICSKEEAI
jgi:hypothetical protein